MTKEIRDLIVSFLRKNADVFAWSHDDMPSISTNVITHKLNVNLSIAPVKQKRRVFSPERNTAVMEEVDKLLKAGFIREVYYPEWLTNVVMVKNSTGKWQMCVDFTDLNKACPKDSYPLPRIDQLVDSTAGHKITQLHGRLFWLQPDSDDRRGPREDGLHHKQRPFLLQGNALRPKKYWGHQPEIGE
jgi:hypothetical protein